MFQQCIYNMYNVLTTILRIDFKYGTIPYCKGRVATLKK